MGPHRSPSSLEPEAWTMKLPFELTRPLAFLDLETPGLRTVSGRRIELAGIIVSPR